MRRKKRKQQINEELLDAILTVKKEWKQIQSIVEKSIEPSIDGENYVKIAQAKYIFLLQEAKRRKISAIRYNRS